MTPEAPENGTARLSVRQVAEREGVSEKSVRRWMDAGSLGYYRLGTMRVVSEEQLRQWRLQCLVSARPGRRLTRTELGFDPETVGERLARLERVIKELQERMKTEKE